MDIVIKRGISFILSLMMVLSIIVSFPTTVFASNIQTGTTGRCSWKFDEATSTLTISGNGSMGTYNYDNGYYPPWFEKFSPKIVIVDDGVTNISKSAFEGCGTITSISLGDTITSIGNYAFRCCTNLTDINIPESVTTIGEEAFNSCTKLISIIIPDGVTSLGKSAFRYCHSLTSATISKGMTKINDLTFAECENLTQIVIPDGIKSIGQWAFASDSNLENVTLPNSLTSIGNAAFNCAGLTSVVIPDSIKKLDSEGAFAVCEKLQSVTLPEGLKIIGDSTFANCESLTEINIPSSVTELGEYAFSWCTSLEEIILPDKLVTIGENAFWNCVCLSEVSLPKSVTSIGDSAFMDCTSLKSITIPPVVTNIGRYAVGYYADPSIKPIDGFTIYGKVGSIAEQYAIDNSLKFERQTSGITGDCTWNLSGTVLTISGNGSTEHFASSSEAPWDLSVTQIIIEEGVTSIQGGAFLRDLPNLESVFMPDSITFLYDGLFSERENDVIFYCSSESKAAMYALTHSGVSAKYIRGTSGDCNWSLDGTVLTISGNGSMDNYQSHYVPWGREITEVILENGVTSIGNYAFYECKSLEKINIPESVTRIGNCAMEYCTGLQKIYIPSNVTIIAAGAFEYCENLSLVEGLEGLTEWYQYCFANCKSLTDFVIPKNIKSIPYATFSNCSNLHNIYVPSSVNTIENSAFSDIDNLIIYAVRDSFAQHYAESNTQIQYREYAGNCPNCSSNFTYCLYEEATCTQNGAIITNCAKCEYKHTEIILKSGHTYSKTVTPPTCTKKGYTTYICDGCGDTYTDNYVNANGHTSSAPVKENIQPSCTEQGSYDEVIYCSECGQEISRETKSADPLGHHLVFVKQINPTYSCDGRYAHYECDRCGKLYADATGAHEITEDILVIPMLVEETWVYEPTEAPYPATEPPAPEESTYGDYAYKLYSDGHIEITKYNGNDKTVSVPSEINDNPVTVIGEKAFYGNTAMTEVTIPNSVKTIGSNTFSHCTALETVNLPDSIKYLNNGLFSYCTSLKNVTIPSSVTNIGYNAFYHCFSLTNITIPESVTSINSQAFDWCPSLKQVSIPKSVKSIGSKAFGYVCDQKIDGFKILGYENSAAHKYAKANGFDFESTGFIFVPPTEPKPTSPYPEPTEPPTEPEPTEVPIGQIGNYQYDLNTYDKTATLQKYSGKETNVSIPSQQYFDHYYSYYRGYYNIIAIGNAAFAGNSYVKSVTIPNTVTSIGDDAFFRCDSLTTVTIPDSVTSIGSWAFAQCDSLKSITIPSSVTSIGDKAFGFIDANTKVDGFTITGRTGSAAYKYAVKNGFEFVANDSNISGDVDSDYEVTIMDATAIQAYLSYQYSLNGGDYEPVEKGSRDFTVTDVDGDGRISIFDSLRIQRYCAKMCKLDGSPYDE